ncbi:C4-dicarboxylate ABC transporter permease [Rhodovibrio sodomensis]|uniref:C4-dicarboxylate ABC transporter permease n=2 Tax=Rhodovibrio sodomensis TaxID=1088 RepID=A0ABS1DKM7_9PROT|nr:C4-dicarboxylate ABC transporter permease [Rhodovibrio sodomensis]
MNGLGSLIVDGLDALLGLAGGSIDTLGGLGRALQQMAVPPPLLMNALHFAGFAVLAGLFYPMIPRAWWTDSRWGTLADLGLGVVGALAGLYLIAQETAIYDRGMNLAAGEWIAGGVLIVVALELVRRTTGWIVPVLSVLALSYATWLGPEIDGMLQFAGLSAETMLFRTVYGDDGIFGNIAGISASIVVMFILFGAFLLRSGAGDAIVDLAQVVAGRLTGGPGLVAVIASALTGTISGSAVANTAQTGTITIPLMQRSGYPGRFAAGVEAAASTGGQLMPPIMGAGAFIMANYTQIPYVTIISAAALPALLYFLSVAFYVRIEAKRLNLLPEADHGLNVREVLVRGVVKLLAPIGVLVLLLFQGFTPTYSAGLAILAVVAGSWFTSEKMGPRAIAEALANGVRNVTMIAVLLVAIGIFVNVIPTTGLGNLLSLMISQWADGNLLIAFVLVALASLVLGMGLPVTAAYVVLAVLSAPALRDLIVQGQILEMLESGTLPEAARSAFMLVDPNALAKLAQPMGAAAAQALLDSAPPEVINIVREQALSDHAATFALLSAHMIIFWLSQDSNVTPPVCLTAFTGAAIAGTDPMKTGVQAWKIAKGLYMVPLLFAYTPLLGGTWHEVLEIFVVATLGLYCIAAGLQGYLVGPLVGPVGWLARGGLLAAGALLFWPGIWWTHAAGATLFASAWAFNRWRAHATPVPAKGTMLKEPPFSILL